MTAKKRKRRTRPQPSPSQTEQRIETARRRLQRAQAILLCAVHASNHEVEADYADIMYVVVDLIEDVVTGLDAVELARPP